MQVRRAATGVTGVADDLTGHYAVAFTKGAVAVQVCVVMPLEARTENPDDLAAESIRADTRHDAAGRTKYGRVPGRRGELPASHGYMCAVDLLDYVSRASMTVTYNAFMEREGRRAGPAR